MSVVVTVAGAVYGSFILQRGEQFVIGRSLQTELPVDDLRVSRRHCRLEHGDEGVTLTDLRSANGTFLNGQRVQRALVRNGDRLTVGNAELRVQVDFKDEPAPDPVYTCGECRRQLSAMTLSDGQVIQLEGRFVCPQCREKLATPAFSLLELDLVRRLFQEGFEVLEKLSIQGAVPIYKARKTSLDQLVAIKALPLGEAVSQKKIQRFVQEAKSQARLRHKNIVSIYDVRATREVIYIVMELIEGETLLQMIQRAGTRLAVQDSLRVAYQVALALGHAFEKGIIHRDVKPSNVMIGPEGDARLIDFGLAKNLREVSLGITADGETLGTLGYMAPEQVHTAKLADQRADVYGLGATLYHCLAGRPPFLARNEATLIKALRESRGPPLEPLAGVPMNVVSLVMRMMSHRPEERHQTPSELLRDIERIASEVVGIAADAGNVEFLLKMRDEESDLLQTWRSRGPARTSALLGSFRDAELAEFLQMLEFNQKTGVLDVGHGQARGRVHIREGRIVRAEAGSYRGEAALLRILNLKQGDFEFDPGELPVPGECDLRISQVLLDAMRVRDESQEG